MPIYSEIISNDKILNLIDNNIDTILIIGCGGCMNESLAYKYNRPIIRITDNGEKMPMGIYEELQRIATFLQEKGFSVQTKVNKEGSSSFGCMTNTTASDCQLLKENDQKPDLILAASCPAGAEGFRRLAGDIPVICITNQLGAMCYAYNIKPTGEKDIIKGSVKICPFSSL